MLPLREAQSVEDLADLLYEFLPGSGNSKTERHPRGGLSTPDPRAHHHAVSDEAPQACSSGM